MTGSAHRRGSFTPPCADLASDGWKQVRAVQLGNTAQFEHIYRQHVSMIQAYLLQQTGDWMLAQDLTSETFIRALRAVRRVSYQGKPLRSWLFTIARNVFLDHFKSFRTRNVVPVDVGQLTQRAELSAGPEELALARDVCQNVRSALGELSESQRHCLTLRFLVGLSVAETASEMNRSSEAVRSIQHRALRKLGAMLVDEDELELVS